jgi:uncharacterized protein YggU (UPF0235/DUF167 family)
MNKRKYIFHDGQAGAAIAVRLDPCNGRNTVSKILEDGTILIQLSTQNGVENLNDLLISYLAQILGVNHQQVEIVGGKSGNDKLVTIIDLDKDTVQARILQNL